MATHAPAERAGAETPDRHGAFPRLTAEQIAVLADQGERHATHPGEVLVGEGQRSDRFTVVVRGKVAVVEALGTPQERIVAVHGPGRFLGELGLLTGAAAFVSSVVVEAGEVLHIPVARLHDLVADDPALADLILRAYLLRRTMLIGLGTGLRILGSRYSPDTRRLRDFAARNRIPHRWVDLEDDDGAEALLRELAVRPDEAPVVVLQERRVLRNPSNAELAHAIGLSSPASAAQACDLVVVGAGPAGLAAAVYAASEGLAIRVLDAVATGGQAGMSARIENYLGFPAGISGGELADRAALQASKFGARVTVPAEATSFGERDGHYVVGLGDGAAVCARSVVLATGARYRTLDMPGLAEVEGSSVYYAATQVEAQVCRRDPVAVVGGGNSAGQATLFLAQHARHVHLLVRGDDLSENMSRYLVDEIERTANVTVSRHTQVREAFGERGVLHALAVADLRTGQRRRIDARALFVFVGATPCTAWLAGEVDLDEHGFVLTGQDPRRDGGPDRDAANAFDADAPPLALETNRRGVFAVGDVRSGSVKRVASAVGEGAMAVRFVHERAGSGPMTPNAGRVEDSPASGGASAISERGR